MHQASSRALLTLLTGIIFLVGLAGFAYYYVPFDLASLSYYRERASYIMEPSAGKAYTYGLGHFSSTKPDSYDIDRAEYFFRKASEQDATYGHSHHQLARIAFLRGEFGPAMQEIEREIALHPDNPNAYYVRGLIAGYQGAYATAARDFAQFLTLVPDNWAGYNDYAWVLTKKGDYQTAIDALEDGLEKFPGNPWLLNSYAVALYEAGHKESAANVATLAKAAVMRLSPEDWSLANPGNDPRIAGQGLETFRSATIQNLNTIMNSATSTN